MSIKSYLIRALSWWNSQTWNTQFWTWRHGVKVGEDTQGNIYYHTKDDKRRWVIYNGESEASRVPPDWNGWLHFTYKEPPTKAALVHRDWQAPHEENRTGQPGAYYPAGSLYRADPKARSDYDAWQPE